MANYRLRVGPSAAPSLPAWYTAANANEWVELPSSTITSSGVGWAGTNPGGATYEKIISAWGGGILNTVGLYHGGVFISGVFLVIFGGGHSDYAGNELYAYGPINVGTPVWRRLNDPTIPAANDAARIGGKPVSRHTYDNLVYLPTINKLLAITATGTYSGANSYMVADLFDFNVDPTTTNPWSAADTGFPASIANAGFSAVSGYNPTTGKASFLAWGTDGKFCSFDVATLTWTSNDLNNGGMAQDSKGAVIPSSNILVTWKNDGGVRALNLATHTAYYEPSFTGTSNITRYGTLEWDSTANRFVSWDNLGKTIRFLTPGANPASGGDSWTWTSFTPSSGATPPDLTGIQNGVFGRFRYCSELNGIVLMPYRNLPMYFYKF